MQDSSIDRYFSGAVDEVRVYKKNLITDTTGRSDVYIPNVTAETLITNDTTPDFYGTVISDAYTTIAVTLSGIGNSYRQTYNATNNGSYKWSLS